MALSRSYYILHWNAKEVTVFPLRLVHSSSRTSKVLKLACTALQVFALAPFFKTPQSSFTECVVRRRAAMLPGPPAPSDPLMSSPTGHPDVSNLLEPRRAEENKGWGFEAPLKRQQWLGSPFKNTSWTAISRTCFVAGRLLI